MEILSVIYNPVRQMFGAMQEHEGRLIHLAFPADTLEWRSAEYQIEPTETDLLLDIVLYELHLNTDPAALEPSVLWTADTVEEARERHVAAIMEAKQRLRPAGPRSWRDRSQRVSRLRESGVDREWLDAVADDDALKPIRDNHIMDIPVVIEKALLVEKQRAKFKLQQEAARQAVVLSRPSAHDRAAMIRAMREMGDPK